ncbi:MAG: septum formation initiator family protein [Candidatus Magasanikbacteria bacterium]
MKWWKLIILIFLGMALGVGVYNLYKKKETVEAEYNKKREKLKDKMLKNDTLKSKVNYFKEEPNLAEEARETFRYKKPGEKMMIIVPSESDQ